MLVDGYTGEVLIDPTDEAIEAARARRDRRSVTVGAGRRRAASGPVVTADGVPVRFQANSSCSRKLDAARAAGAEGIGLFRSEYLLGGRPVEAFDEDAQFAIYRELVERMAPHPVTVRTFDVDEAQARSSASDRTARATAIRRLARPARPAGDPPEPEPPRPVRRAAARAGAGRRATARCACCSRSCRAVEELREARAGAASPRGGRSARAGRCRTFPSA